MSSGGTTYVLDSYAVLAYLQGEPSQATLISILESARAGRDTALLCLINLGEVVYITERERGLVAAHKVIAAIDQLPVTLVTPDRDLVLAAAHIKAGYPLSYADAFVVAVAQRAQGTIVTGDPEFGAVETVAQVMWV